MKVVQVTMARVVVLVPMAELNPGGRIDPLEVGRRAAERYKFAKYPRTFDEWSDKDGAKLIAGRLDDIAISQAVLYAGGVGIEVISSTEDANKVLDDFFQWSASDFGLAVPDASRPRWYTSELVFVSDMVLDSIHPAFKLVSDRITDALSSDVRHVSRYETVGIGWNLDDFNLKVPPGQFRIERRAGSSFNENRWFSSAPIPTEAHVALLSDFEAAILAKK